MAGSSNNIKVNVSNSNTKSIVAYYEGMESKSRLTGMTFIKQSHQNFNLNSRKMTVSSSSAMMKTRRLGFGESTSSSALEIFNVTNLKRSLAFNHHRKNLQRHQKGAPQNWRQSVIRWQEKATKCQEVALTQRYLEHLGYDHLSH